MEYQFAFQKHPEIGPPDGSLTAEELRSLVDFPENTVASKLGKSAVLRAFSLDLTAREVCPPAGEVQLVDSLVREETYQLLDDLYSEVCPLLPFEMFNVCCDETYGLGEGPSKELAEKIGVGGVYVRHIQRIYQLLREKHYKRTMMWGYHPAASRAPARFHDVDVDLELFPRWTVLNN